MHVSNQRQCTYAGAYGTVQVLTTTSSLPYLQALLASKLSAPSEPSESPFSAPALEPLLSMPPSLRAPPSLLRAFALSTPALCAPHLRARHCQPQPCVYSNGKSIFFVAAFSVSTQLLSQAWCLHDIHESHEQPKGRQIPRFRHPPCQSKSSACSISACVRLRDCRLREYVLYFFLINATKKL